MSSHRFFPYFLITVAGLIWGATFSLALIATGEGAHPLAISSWQVVVTGIFFFVFCGVMLWKGIDFAWTSLSRLEPDATPWRAPLYPIKMMIPLGALLILLQGLAKFIRDLVTAITGREEL